MSENIVKLLWIWEKANNIDTTSKGINPANISRTPVLQLEELGVRQFAIGKTCGAILSDDDVCYQVGNPSAMDLTLSGIESALCEVSFLGSYQVTTVACGYHHIAVLVGSGAAYCWGASQGGQCGVVADFVAEPSPIRNSEKTKSVQFSSIACGKSHTMAISSKHELWGWGLSHIIGGASATRKNIPCTKPEIVERLCGRKVLQMSCGKNHTVVITEKIIKTPTSEVSPESSEVCSLCKQEIYKWGDLELIMQERDDHVIITDTHICTHGLPIDSSMQLNSDLNSISNKVKTHNRSSSLPFFKRDNLATKMDRLSKTPPVRSSLSIALENAASRESLASTKSESGIGNIEMNTFSNIVRNERKENSIKHSEMKPLFVESNEGNNAVRSSDSSMETRKSTATDQTKSSLQKSVSIPADLYKQGSSKDISHFPFKILSDDFSDPLGHKFSSFASLDDCKSRMTLPISPESDLAIDSESALDFLKQLSPSVVEVNDNIDQQPAVTDMTMIDTKVTIGSQIDTITKEKINKQSSLSEKLSQSITDNKILSPLTSYSRNVYTGVMDGIEWIKTSTYDKGVAPIRELWSKESGSKSSVSASDYAIDSGDDPLHSDEKIDIEVENEYDGALTLRTEVWTWGENINGELGHADTLDRFQPTCIKSLSHRGIVKISCGSHHTIALTANSDMYSWGRNNCGQLGHDNNANNHSPSKIECKNRIWDIAAGRHHTLLLVDSVTQEPNILICGVNSAKNLTLTHPLRSDDKKTLDNWKLKPVDFSPKMGFQYKVTAGFSNLSSCQSEKNISSSTQMLHTFAKSEREFFQHITMIKTEVLSPLKFSDLYKSLELSTYGEILSIVLKHFSTLSTEIGLNTVCLTQAITSGEKCQQNTFSYCGNNLINLYEWYFHSLNDIIAYGFFEKCEALTSKGNKFLAVSKNVQLFKKILGEKRFSKLSSENFLQTLQLPAFRIREYARFFNRLSAIMEEDMHLSEYMEEFSSRWDNLWTKINNQLHSANNTRGFWKNEFKIGGGKLAESLKKVGRYLLIHSKKVPLDVANSGRFSMNWFILFNDCLVLVHYGAFFIHPLNILWCTSVTDTKNKSRLIKITTPEEVILASAGTNESKSSWINAFNRAINHVVWSDEMSPEHNHETAQYHITPPTSRHASHTFTKDLDLKGAYYTGAWYNGKPHGKGDMMWTDGRQYTGNYKNGKEDGYGEWKASHGDTSKLKYQGWWKDGKMNGFGKLWFNRYQTYEGSFVDGFRDGHGVLRTGSVTEGSVYVGAWKKDQRNGFGVEDNVTKGVKYLGMWTNDQRHGVGILVTLDGVYCQSRFTHNEINGDTLLIEGRYVFEGHVAAAMMLNGKGRLTLPTGDKLEGSFSGPWGENIRVSGNLLRIDCSTTPNKIESPGASPESSSSFTNIQHPNQTRNILRRYNRHIMKKYVDSKLFRSFPLSLHPDNKWTELFEHCRKSLGCPLKDDEQDDADTRKIWEAISVAMSNARHKREQFSLSKVSPQKKANETKLNCLERIPSVVTQDNDQLTHDDIATIREYLTQAFSTMLHPLGELVESLGDVFRDSYSSAGAHKWLLSHAVADVHSFVRRSYDILRLMFPQLEKEHGISHMKIINNHADVSNSEEALNISQDEVTAGDLLLPVLLPRVYPTLFTLYALRHENEDRSYWERVTRLNRHPDVALLSFLGVKPKFWLLDDKEIPPLESSPEDGELYGSIEQAESSKWRHLLVARAKDCSFLTAVEALQLISTTFIPAEKLNVIHSTFKEINATVLKHHNQTHAWSMDDLFPVFQYVVIRSRISHLGCEIQLVEDFLESDMCKGEKGIMFTTLKACYFQIRVEKDL